MERGGLRASRERVVLVSTTHGAEMHSLAAAMAVMQTHREEAMTQRLHDIGDKLAAGVREASAAMDTADHVLVRGRSSNLVFATPDNEPKPSQEQQTLFMRVLIRGGVLGPSFVVSSEITDEDFDKTVGVVARRALCTATHWTGTIRFLARWEVDQAGSVATCDVTVSLAPGI